MAPDSYAFVKGKANQFTQPLGKGSKTTSVATLVNFFYKKIDKK